MGLPEVLIALIVIGLPIMALTAIATHWFRLKEKRVVVEANAAAEKAAQYAASNAELEARVRVAREDRDGRRYRDRGPDRGLAGAAHDWWRESPVNRIRPATTAFGQQRDR